MNQMISYAQNGEDVILRRIFENQKTGFYIDIGASHPEFLSVTKHFYDQGWRGINVDPLKKSIDIFVKERPRDINLNLAISSENGLRDFFEVTDYPELSTFSAEALLDVTHNVISYPVEIITGDKLFSEYVTTAVDFMKIDVEGAEYEVITSIDFSKYRPKVLVIEATVPNAEFPGWHNLSSIFSFKKWEEVLFNSGYIFAYFDGLNRFYLSEENRELLDYFQVGLCHWDNFFVNSQVKRIAELEWHCEERMNQIETLIKRIAELEWHCEERMKQIEILTTMVK
jgi:FkbM family methyltransferase